MFFIMPVIEDRPSRRALKAVSAISGCASLIPMRMPVMIVS